METSLIKFGLNGGTNLKYLSGGEKRKLSLASEVRKLKVEIESGK
jgi:ABC-type multidrug transport system ATPase subunit